MDHNARTSEYIYRWGNADATYQSARQAGCMSRLYSLRLEALGKRLRRELASVAGRQHGRETAQAAALPMNVVSDRHLDRASVLIVTAGGELHDQRRRLRQIFNRAIVIKHHREHIDQIRAVDNTKLVWYVPSNMTIAMVRIELDKMATEELASACLASRFFGGYIADDEWLAACEDTFPITGTVPEPMVHMLPGIQDQRELLIHGSVKDAAGWAMRVLSCVDGKINPMSRWVVRLDRLEGESSFWQ